MTSVIGDGLRQVLAEDYQRTGGAVHLKSGEPHIETNKELAKIAKFSQDRMAKVKVIQENVTAEQNDKLDGD